MKLKTFNIINEYLFHLEFENGTKTDTNIKELVSNKVSIPDLKSARLDEEWGCLEFCNGMIDIEPNTLYKYALNFSKISA